MKHLEWYHASTAVVRKGFIANKIARNVKRNYPGWRNPMQTTFKDLLSRVKLQWTNCCRKLPTLRGTFQLTPLQLTLKHRWSYSMCNQIHTWKRRNEVSFLSGFFLRFLCGRCVLIQSMQMAERPLSTHRSSKILKWTWIVLPVSNYGRISGPVGTSALELWLFTPSVFGNARQFLSYVNLACTYKCYFDPWKFSIAKFRPKHDLQVWTR